MNGAKKAKLITIDGPSGSGKGTVARIVAETLGMNYMDTGSMYRAFAVLAREENVKPGQRAQVERLIKQARFRFVHRTDGGCSVTVNGRDVSDMIRSPEISESASVFSKIGAVRQTLGRFQRENAGDGVVAEGRDMGTTVFADADHKFFLTAELRERARRRNSDLLRAGRFQNLEETAREMELRDGRDEQRKLSPLKPACDAVIIDTTHLCVSEVVKEILRRCAN